VARSRAFWPHWLDQGPFFLSTRIIIWNQTSIVVPCEGMHTLCDQSGGEEVFLKPHSPSILVRGDFACAAGGRDMREPSR